MTLPRTPLLAYLERTLAMFEQSGDVDGIGLTSLRLARAQHAAGAPTSSITSVLTHALQKLEGYNRGWLRAQLYTAFAELGCGSVEHRNMALDEAERLSPDNVAGRVAVEMARSEMDIAAGRLELGASRHARAAEQLLGAGSNPNLVAEQRLIEAQLHRMRRDPRAALAALSHIELESCQPQVAAAAMEQQGWLSLESGDTTKALALATRGVERLGEADAPRLLASLHLLEVDAALVSGDLEAARGALALVPSIDHPETRSHVSLCRAELCLAAGDTDGAIRQEGMASQQLRDAPAPSEVLIDRLDDLRMALGIAGSADGTP